MWNVVLYFVYFRAEHYVGLSSFPANKRYMLGQQSKGFAVYDLAQQSTVRTAKVIISNNKTSP